MSINASSCFRLMVKKAKVASTSSGGFNLYLFPPMEGPYIGRVGYKLTSVASVQLGAKLASALHSVKVFGHGPAILEKH
jgi:hypothetical protein